MPAGGQMGAAQTGARGYIERWRPVLAPAEAASFARAVVQGCGPHGRERAKNLLWAAGRLADWAIPLGLEPVPGVLLHPSVIERFTAHAPGLTGVTRRTLRTNLRFAARAVVPQLQPADASLPRERARAPYSPAEIDGYLALADAQPAAARRMRAAGLVCLGAGAGLIRADLRTVRGTDICCRSGGVIVDVRGGRPRVVPVLALYHDVLLESAQFAGDQLITGGTDPQRHNITTPLVAALAGGTGLPRLDTSRLRATWCARPRTPVVGVGSLAVHAEDLLEASIPAEHKDASTALAADWTDVETFSRPPRHGSTETSGPGRAEGLRPAPRW